MGQVHGLTGAMLTGGALSALTLGFPAVAPAAPSGIGSAQDAVNELENQGFAVVIYRAGTKPLDRCTIASVRPAQAPDRTVHLSANC